MSFQFYSTTHKLCMIYAILLFSTYIIQNLYIVGVYMLALYLATVYRCMVAMVIYELQHAELAYTFANTYF